MGILAANCWLGHSPPCRKSQRGTDRNGDYSYFAGLAGGGRGWQQSCQLRLEGGRLSRTAFAWKPRRDRHGCAGFLLFGSGPEGAAAIRTPVVFRSKSIEACSCFLTQTKSRKLPDFIDRAQSIIRILVFSQPL